ncbi:hypothetical protein HK101_003506, partial [Irineochytrium annulatum]
QGILFAVCVALCAVTIFSAPTIAAATKKSATDVLSKMTGSVNNEEATSSMAAAPRKVKNEFNGANLGKVRFQYRGLLGWTEPRLAALTYFDHPIKQRSCLTFVHMEGPIGLPKTFNLSSLRPDGSGAPQFDAGASALTQLSANKPKDVEAGAAGASDHSVASSLTSKSHLIVTMDRDEVRILVNDPKQRAAITAVLQAVAVRNGKAETNRKANNFIGKR